eukprot:s531_g22.t1
MLCWNGGYLTVPWLMGKTLYLSAAPEMQQRHDEPVEATAGMWALLPSCWLSPVQDAGREQEEVELARRNRWITFACRAPELP